MKLPVFKLATLRRIVEQHATPVVIVRISYHHRRRTLTLLSRARVNPWEEAQVEQSSSRGGLVLTILCLQNCRTCVSLPVNPMPSPSQYRGLFEKSICSIRDHVAYQHTNSPYVYFVIPGNPKENFRGPELIRHSCSDIFFLAKFGLSKVAQDPFANIVWYRERS